MKTTSATRNRRKALLAMAWIGAISVLMMVSGCATVSPEEFRMQADAQLEDASKSLWITIQSVPSGATVYGDSNGQPGTKLGTTPLTLKYTWMGVQVWGTAPNETLFMKFADSMPWSLSKAFVAFKCIVTMDSYYPYQINQILVDKSRYWGARGVIDAMRAMTGCRRTFTAMLQPVAGGPSAAPAVPIQQQQQQTIVIPDVGKRVPAKGTVMVTCTPENAEVSVDGVFVGNSPSTLSVTEGIHIVEVRAEGYKPFKRELRVMSGSEVTIRATLDKE